MSWMRERKRWPSRVALAAVALIGAVAGGLGVAAPAAQAADPAGCSFGVGGPHAGSICWLDFASFDQTQAGSPAGQHVRIPLPGGYRVDFDLSYEVISGSGPAAGAFAASVPTWSGSVFGRTVYAGVRGEPALASGNASTTRYTLKNVALADPAGARIDSGYALLTMDAEAMAPNEGITWRSDAAFGMLGDLAEGARGCGIPVGIGTTEVVCNGEKPGAPILQASDATWISADLTGGGSQNVAFGIEFAKIELRKSFDGRVDPADSVDLSIASPAGTVIGAASTGDAATATTGSQPVLPVGAFTLRETPTAGTPTTASNYATSWTCVNRTDGSAVMLRGSGATRSITPKAGDDIVCTVTNTAKARSLAIVKSLSARIDANHDGLISTGDRLTYAFAVENTGELTLHDLRLSDPKVGAVTCEKSVLEPGESTTCTSGEYTVTADDLAAGLVRNTATGSALPPGSSDDDARVTATSNTVETPLTAPAPGLTLKKSASASGSPDRHAGDVVEYRFVVENTGNVPVSEVRIVEGMFSGTGELSAVDCPSTALAPAATVICSAEYRLTQEDVDRGEVSNTATATSTDPDGDAVDSNPSSAEVVIDAAPAIDLVKRVASKAPQRAGDVIRYEFEVTNSGNLTLSDPSIVEGAFSGVGALGEVDCPAGTLRPGASAVCTADYVVTQADVDTGRIENTATATADAADGSRPESDESTAEVVIAAAPAMTIVKTADVQEVSEEGQEIRYTFSITNTGNVTLHEVEPVEVLFDGEGSLGSVRCADAGDGLAPGAARECTAPYTVVKADLTGTPLTNTATAAGIDPAGAEVVPEHASTVKVDTVVPRKGGLASTGSEPMIGAAAGALLLVGVGAGLLLRRRRAQS